MFDRAYLECPKCGRHTIVKNGEARWSCINCDFSRDLNANDAGPLNLLLLMAMTALAIALVAELLRPPIQPRRSSDRISPSLVQTPPPLQ